MGAYLLLVDVISSTLLLNSMTLSSRKKIGRQIIAVPEIYFYVEVRHQVSVMIGPADGSAFCIALYVNEQPVSIVV